jgi:hypothetical protein
MCVGWVELELEHFEGMRSALAHAFSPPLPLHTHTRPPPLPTGQVLPSLPSLLVGELPIEMHFRHGAIKDASKVRSANFRNKDLLEEYKNRDSPKTGPNQRPKQGEIRQLQK